MTPIETKLKELELSVIKAKAFERTLQIAIAHGMKIDIPTPIKAEEAEKLIQALREAVGLMRSLRCDGCPKNNHVIHKYGCARSLAEDTFATIEKILNGGK